MKIVNFFSITIVISFLLISSAFAQQNFDHNCYQNPPEGLGGYHPPPGFEYDINDTVIYHSVPPPSFFNFGPYRYQTYAVDYHGLLTEYVISEKVEHQFNHPSNISLRRTSWDMINILRTASCWSTFSVSGDPQIAPRYPWPEDGLPPEVFRKGSFRVSITTNEGLSFAQPIRIENTGYSDLIVNAIIPAVQTDRIRYNVLNVDYDYVIPPGGEQLYWLELEILDLDFLLQNYIVSQTFIIYSNDPRDYVRVPGINESRGGWHIPATILFNYFPNIDSIPPSQKYDPPPSAQSSDDVIDYILGRYWLKEDANADGLIDAGDVTEFVIVETASR